MTRDANQIAQEHSRRGFSSGETGSRFPVGPFDPKPETKPTRGTFRVWKDGDLVNEESDKFDDVTVELGVPGTVRLGMPHGTMLLYPQPGWYCEFTPNDEGE